MLGATSTIRQQLAACWGASTTFVAQRRLALSALVFGKALDAISTVVVLSIATNVYESNPLVRNAIHKFGLIEGVLLTAIPAILGLMILAETGAGLVRVLPAAWTPPNYPAMIRYMAYGMGTIWYSYLGIHNFSLLL